MSARKAVTAIFASCALFAGAVSLAQQPQKDEHEGHHPEEQKKAPPAKPAPPKPAPAKPAAQKGAAASAPGTGSAMGLGMMDDHMKAMREQMAKIRAAQDPKERQRLMDEHMQSMQKGMAMMQGMAAGRSAAGAAPPAMRMERMEQRMDMMQMMMEQMMARQRATEGVPK